MNHSARLLIVDDDPGLLKVLSEALRSGGYEVWPAATGTEGLQQARERHPDVVLLDVGLPDISGTEVCRQLKHDPALADVLVALISGEATSGSQQLEGAEAGADDYILKPIGAEELLARVRMLVRLKKSAAALRASEQRYRRLLEILPEGIGMIDLQGRILTANRQAAVLLGYSSAEDLVQKSIIELAVPQRQSLIQTGLDQTAESGVVRNATYSLLRRDGSRVPVEVSAAVVPDAAGRPSCLVGVVRDITERAAAEAMLRASEERFRQLAEHIREVFWMTDTEKRQMIYISPAYEEIWGRSRESLYASPLNWVEAIHPEDRDRVREAALTKQVSGTYNEMYRIVTPDGSIRWIQDRAFPVRAESGEVYRVVGIAEDITDRRRAEEQVRLLANAVESTRELISITDRENRFIFVNQAFLEAYGYAEEEVIGQTPAMLYSPKNPIGLCDQVYQTTLEGGWKGEIWNRRRDGTEFPVFLSTAQIKNNEGKILGLIGVAIDISERRRVEKQNAAFSELGHRLSAATTPNQAASIILEVASELFGWDAGYVDLFSPQDDAIIPVLTMDTVRGDRRTIAYETLPLKPTQFMRLVMREGARLVERGADSAPGVDLVPFGDVSRRSESSMYVPIRSSQAVLGILSIQSYALRAYSAADLRLLQTMADHCGDALQRINMTEALRKAEADYRSIFENATEGIFRTSPEGRLLSGNPALAGIFGYESVGEMVASLQDVGSQVYVLPESRAELKRALERTGSVHGFETENRRKDGTKIWISLNGHAVRDHSGKIQYFEGTIQDVTERRRDQHRLADALELNLTILAAAAVGIRAFRASGQCIFANGAAARIAGGTPEQLLEQNYQQLVSWRRSGLLEMAEEALRSRKVQAREVNLITSFGRNVWVNCHMAPFVSGGELHLLVLNHEITDRKRAAEALEESQRRQMALLNNIPDPAWLKDAQGRYLACNPALAKFYASTPEKIVGKSVLDLSPADGPVLAQEDLDVMTSGKPGSFETARTDSHGSVRWLEAIKAPVRNERGEVTGTVGIARDVTERKRIEAQLHELSRRILEAQELERQRVARELHDAVNQLLASAQMRLRLAEQKLENASPYALEMIARCREVLVQALEENRRIAHDLRPTDLDQLGFTVACRNFCTRFRQRTGLAVRCSITRLGQRLPQEMELHLFRIVQEAFNNIEKHAHANAVQVRMTLQQGALHLRVHDDGRGFEPRRPGHNKSKRKGGIGLTNISERAAAMGGSSQFISLPGQGTTVLVQVPMPKPE